MAYVELLLDDINNPALSEERKLNIDAAAYEKKIDANMNRPSDKNKFIVMMKKSNDE